MKIQEVFDRVALHLITQRCRSVERDDRGVERCMYRGPNGLKCAVGAIIPDECYNPILEDSGARWVIGVHKPAPRLVGELIYRKVAKPEFQAAVTCISAFLFGEESSGGVRDDIGDLLQDLQGIHDNTPPDFWRDQLKKTAGNHGLSDLVVRECGKPLSNTDQTTPA